MDLVVGRLFLFKLLWFYSLGKVFLWLFKNTVMGSHFLFQFEIIDAALLGHAKLITWPLDSGAEN